MTAIQALIESFNNEEVEAEEEYNKPDTEWPEWMRNDRIAMNSDPEHMKKIKRAITRFDQSIATATGACKTFLLVKNKPALLRSDADFSNITVKKISLVQQDYRRLGFLSKECLYIRLKNDKDSCKIIQAQMAIWAKQWQTFKPLGIEALMALDKAESDLAGQNAQASNESNAPGAQNQTGNPNPNPDAPEETIREPSLPPSRSQSPEHRGAGSRSPRPTARISEDRMAEFQSVVNELPSELVSTIISLARNARGTRTSTRANSRATSPPPTAAGGGGSIGGIYVGPQPSRVSSTRTNENAWRLDDSDIEELPREEPAALSPKRRRPEPAPSLLDIIQDDIENPVISKLPDGSDPLAMMYAQSMSVNFNIHLLVPFKFDGVNTDKFPEFESLWLKANKQMKSLQFSKVSRFTELKKVLTGSALAYILHLPLNRDDSYDLALRTLSTLYRDQKSALMAAVQKVLQSPVSNGSIADRQKFHANLISYKQTTVSLGASSAECLLAWELSTFESRLDDQWRKDWIKFCAKHKNIRVPLGMDMDLEKFATRLHLSLIEQMKVKAAQEAAPPRRSKEIRGTANAVAAGRPKNFKQSGWSLKPLQTKNKGKPQQQKSQSNKDAKSSRRSSGSGKENVKPPPKAVKCPFCVQSDRTNKFPHIWPLQCPLVKGDNKLSDAEIKRKVKEGASCENCFGPHGTQNCDAPRFVKCRVQGCSQRHHSIFHQ